jgi:hypothetical protein
MIDYKALRCDLVRAARGKRSQERVSKALRFRSNSVYRWEAGTASITWLQFVELCRVCRCDLSRAVHYILGFDGEPTDIPALLRHLTGSARISEIARKTGYSRFVVSKWMSGKAGPGLDDVLRILDESQFVLIEFLEAIAPKEKMPMLASLSVQLKRQKDAIYSYPEGEALLCCLATERYKARSGHAPGLIAGWLGISPEREIEILRAFKDAGLVFEDNGKFAVRSTQIDTQGNFRQSIAIRKYWADRYRRFLDKVSPPETTRNKFGYFVLDLSEDGERQALQAYHEYCFKLRAIAQSDRGPKVTVKLYAAQIMDLLDAVESPNRPPRIDLARPGHDNDAGLIAAKRNSRRQARSRGQWRKLKKHLTPAKSRAESTVKLE